MISRDRENQMELAADLLWIEFKDRCRRGTKPTAEECYKFLDTCGYGDAVAVCASEDFLETF